MTIDGTARIEQIRALCRAGQVAAAFEAARTNLHEVETGGGVTDIAEARIALAHVYFRMGHYGQARALLHQALAQTPADHPLQVDALIHLGMCAAETDAPDEAEAYYRRAVDLSRMLGYEEALYRGLHALAAGIYIPRGQFDLALTREQDAYDFIVARGKPELGWSALAAMGWVYWATGRPQEAMRKVTLLRSVAPEGSLPRGFHDQLLADLAKAWLLMAGLLLRMSRDEEEAWAQAIARIRRGRFHFLLERERAIVFPLIQRHLRGKNARAREEARDLLHRLTATPPRPLRIHALGRFEVWQGPRRIEDRVWNKRRAGALFRLLLISPRRSRTHEQIVEALWPDKSFAAARSLLHQSTSALRRILEPDLPRQFPSRYLEVDGECVTLHLPSDSWVEHEVFTELVQTGAYAQALTLYGGMLFPQDPYADWAVWERERLAQRYLQALLGAAENALAEDRPDDALTLARKALELEPWQEHAAHIGMEACLALGDRAGALRLYRALAGRLQEELGIGPGEELRVFYRKIAAAGRS